MALAAWLTFTLWMFSYEMPLSALYGLVFLWTFRPRPRQRIWLRRSVLLLSPLVIWNVGLVEYGRKTLDLHCRVLGYAGQPEARFCSQAPGAHARGRAHTEGDLFSPLEHVGVHGFNVILAGGGLLAGLPRVAWETLFMSFAADPFPGGASNQSRSVRRRQCVGGEATATASTSRGPGGFLMDSKTVRQLVAKNVRSAKGLSLGKTRAYAPATLMFSRPAGMSGHGSDEQYYGGLMRQDNLEAPLTLVVPDGRIHVTATNPAGDPQLEIRWTGTISYPPNAQFNFPLPTVWQLPGVNSITKLTKPFPLLISEGIFCGMAMDGAMNPYLQEWRTSIPASDPRLTPQGQQESVHGWIELLLGLMM